MTIKRTILICILSIFLLVLFCVYLIVQTSYLRYLILSFNGFSSNDSELALAYIDEYSVINNFHIDLINSEKKCAGLLLNRNKETIIKYSKYFINTGKLELSESDTEFNWRSFLYNVVAQTPRSYTSSTIQIDSEADFSIILEKNDSIWEVTQIKLSESNLEELEKGILEFGEVFDETARYCS